LIKHKDHNSLVLLLQGLQAGISGAQTGIQGAGMGLQGVQGAQAGFGLVGRMGEQAANIGSQRQQADLSRLGFQGQMGEQQQQQQQQIINQSIQDYALSQEMPMQRLAGFNALLRGYATPTTTTQQYQAAPNALQSIGALGTAAGSGIAALMVTWVKKLAAQLS
jgi:transcription initiation factor TFIID subunit TAF12